MTKMGLKDLPIDKIEEESLGLSKYSTALSEFVKLCETPMTIALQGDWGSGKTSLMNLIRATLDNNSKDQIHTIWFNTWQYSQFEMQEDLAISLISHFIDDISGEADKRITKKTLMNLSLKGTKLLSGLVGNMVGAGAGFSKGLDSMFETFNEIDPPKQIMKLKDDIKVAVDKHLKSNKQERIVVFVDDLDRLLPEKAVELLEVFKLFLDIPDCVYVLACDYQVIAQGLKKKFGIGSDDLKGKSFFDKIIQLPFQMPIGQYDVNKYITKLLGNIGIEYDESDDVSQYRDLINYSVGFNPRTIKRLFNSLQLLKMVAEQQQMFDDIEIAKKNEKQKIIFATLCLQMAYETLYRYLQKNEITQSLLKSLMDGKKISDDDIFKDIRKEIENGTGADLNRLVNFMRTLYNCLQLKSDGNNENISDKEIDTFREILFFSALTSTGNSVTPLADEAKEMVAALRDRLTEKYANLTDKLDTSFSRYMTKLTLPIEVNGGRIKFEAEYFVDENKIGMWAKADSRESREELGKWLDGYFDKEEKPYKAYDEEDLYFAEFWEIKNILSLSEAERQFEEKIIESLNKLLPRLVEKR